MSIRTIVIFVAAAIWLTLPATGRETEREATSWPAPLADRVSPEDTVPKPTQASVLAEVMQHQSREIYEIMQHQSREILKMRAALEHLVDAAHEQLEVGQNADLPPLEDGTLRAFRLKYVDPEVLAHTLEVLLGPNRLRLVPDSSHGTLLAYADRESMNQLEELVEQLDASTTPKESTEPRSLMVRIFWLADGLPEADGSDAGDYLPDAVLKAIGRLGLRSPRLVSQSTASLAIGLAEEERAFRFKFPAVVHGKHLEFNTYGEMVLNEQPQLSLQLEVSGPFPFALSGRLSAPLGHYMVLGAGNYVADARGGREIRPRGRAARGSGDEGEDGIGPGGYGGEGFGGGEYGGEGFNPAPSGAEGSIEGQMGGRFGGRGDADGPAGSSPKAKLSTSRFAFVVQVIEAESFAPQ